jgi:hypothetical protein
MVKYRSTGKNPSLFILKTFNYYILCLHLITFTIYSAEFGPKKKIGTFYRLINTDQMVKTPCFFSDDLNEGGGDNLAVSQKIAARKNKRACF